MPTAHMIRRRAELTQALRSVFEREGYVEVDTPLLSSEVCVDAYIDPILTAEGQFLQPSPELAMKRLLADADVARGCPAIWQLTKAFRHGEQGTRHHPEFTLCEWYRIGDSHRDQMTFTESLCDAMHRAAGLVPPSRPYPRVPYFEALTEAIAVRDLGPTRGPITAATDPNTVRRIIADAVSRLTQQPVDIDCFDYDGWLNIAVDELIEPFLATHEAVFLTDYPPSQAALATASNTQADRFELYVRGRDATVIELANGYNELTDAAEARRRFEAANTRRADPLPLPEQFLATTDALPACSGVALGWDRLVMHLLGCDTIAAVAVVE